MFPVVFDLPLSLLRSVTLANTLVLIGILIVIELSPTDQQKNRQTLLLPYIGLYLALVILTATKQFVHL